MTAERPRKPIPAAKPVETSKQAATVSTRRRPARAAAPAVEGPRLTRDAWLDAAFTAVVEGGFGDVRVLLLADRLGVTRGSFYWHFADHAGLMQALLARWRAQEEAGLAYVAAMDTGHPRSLLDQLLDHALKRGGKRLANTRFELALRGLARRDEAVANLLHHIDVARVKAFEGLFLRIGIAEQEARELATMFYLGVVGCLHALAQPDATPEREVHLQALMAKYLFDPLVPRRPLRG
jgi:AcrR family transcriptional regulator